MRPYDPGMPLVLAALDLPLVIGAAVGIGGLVLAILSHIRADRAEDREVAAEEQARRAEQRAVQAEERAERIEARERERDERDAQRFERESRDDRIAALERVGKLLREVRDAVTAGLGGDVTSISRLHSAQARLSQAVAVAPAELPECQRIAAGGAALGVAAAEAEVEEAIGNERLGLG
jgi:hypothetical protein